MSDLNNWQVNGEFYMTINQWADLKGIRIIDPDGFDRTDPNLYEKLFTEEEFEKGLYELGEKVGEYATCPNCKELHEVKYGDKVLEDGTKVPTKLLGYVKCGESAYLVAINEKTIKK